MPVPFFEYRVFIATPGGLDDERRAFRETLESYNADEAAERYLRFKPVGWELTLPGNGRPQELINRDLVQCDYFLMILWDRWGTPTSSDPASTCSSGCEEEFELALKCRTDPDRQMRETIILFKSVDPRQLGDPGAQLGKVLAFKQRIEASKEHLFGSFDEIEVFKRTLRRYLSRWTLDHEKGGRKEVRQVSGPAVNSSAATKLSTPSWDTGNPIENHDAFEAAFGRLLKDLRADNKARISP